MVHRVPPSVFGLCGYLGLWTGKPASTFSVLKPLNSHSQPWSSCMSAAQAYVEASVGAEALNVGEFWSDLQWDGGDLAQDVARERLVKWIDENEQP